MKRFLLLFAFAASTITATAQSSSQEALIGCWTMPARIGESIQLYRDGRFGFNDYNTKTAAFEYMSGTWTSTASSITLLYDDRPKQTFTIRKDKAGKMTLTKAGGFLFRKAQPADCSAAEYGG